MRHGKTKWVDVESQKAPVQKYQWLESQKFICRMTRSIGSFEINGIINTSAIQIINKSALMHCPSGNWNYFNFIREWHSDRQKSKFKRILQRRQSSNLNLSTDMTLHLTGVPYIINHRATERSGSKREGWWFAKNAATAFIPDSNKKGEWKRNRIGISGILSTLQRPQQHCHPG